MIKRSKKMLMLRVSSLKTAEDDARRFFGTFINDIKRNWAEVSGPIKSKRKIHHNVSQLTNPV